MDRLGRLLALPLMLIALVMQGMAPAQAAAMPRDVFGAPICTGHGLGGGHGPAPTDGHAHDCCAAACAVAGLLGPLAGTAADTREPFGAPAIVPPPAVASAAAPPHLAHPNARGPPT